ncbi:ArsR/SmtB family transcription factor [Hoeflea olei]|uniref:ArsR family transcriptional regulator n=1 Tax=Hoeflea olei TaxID=1480615 RepID=A0A1C1YZ46_9HYPH|nr:helix-turn-helix domain-containing protein [Hoeflea olei]OCW58745.1 ArsR family transcriptional regulator [Hoeflea olei]
MTNQASATTIAAIAALIGDMARANILSALMSGKALTATELAHHAGVSAPTASAHLARLVDGHLIAVEKQGRHRYYRIASSAVADAFESLSHLAAIGPKRHRPTGPRDLAMRQARTCYDHMAGRLAVAMTDALIARGLIVVEDRSGLVTNDGRRFFADFGIELDPKPKSARPLCRTCLDWSERRMHLGGRLGAQLLDQSLKRHWVRPLTDSRALGITRDGERGFHETFGLPLDLLAPPR